MSPRSRLLVSQPNPATLDPTMAGQHGINPFEPEGQQGVGSAFDMTHAHDLIGATPCPAGIMPPTSSTNWWTTYTAYPRGLAAATTSLSGY
eukprot:3819685-Amphidinium_carterae.2